MDSVVGKRGCKNTKAILAIIERETKQIILELVKDHSSYEVIKALNRIEKRYGRKFYDVFKTITVDNGSEFSDSKGIEKALYRKNNRTQVYYCHPYTSSERGTNEQNNKLIRRHLPKGTDFGNLTRNDVKRIEKWINEYPRELFDGKNSNYMFQREMEVLFENTS